MPKLKTYVCGLTRSVGIVLIVANGSGVPVVGKDPVPKFAIPRGSGNEAPKFVTPNVFGTLAAVFARIFLKKKSYLPANPPRITVLSSPKSDLAKCGVY